jgi:sterol desaturase/sphingolipid hydroxylase (fatty acid hydroxylase superfamily)
MRLSTFGYYVDFFGSFACAVLLCIVAVWKATWLGRTEWLVCVMGGFGLWTFLEYAIHRWLYHGVDFFIRLHDAHHQEPHEHIGAPPFLGIVLIFVVVYAPAMMIAPMVASGLTTGVLAGYMAYQLIHHATHFWKSPRGGYLYRACLHHWAHHYHRELGNFGIMTTFWDHMFGTAIRKARARTTSSAST